MDTELAEAITAASDAADKYEQMHDDAGCEYAADLIAAVRHLEAAAFPWMMALRP